MLGVVCGDVDQLDERKLDNLSVKILYTMSQCVESGVEVGGLLKEAHAILASHHKGSFQKWLQQEFDITPKTAYRYMDAHTASKQLCPGGHNRFSVRSLAALGSRATPVKVVNKAKRLAEEGEYVSEATVRRLVKESKNGAVDFNPDNFEAVTEPPPKNGRPTTASRDRTEAIGHLDKLGRSLTKLGIYDELMNVLSSIRLRIKQL